MADGMRDVALEDATVDDLTWHAKNVLGLDIYPGTGKPKLLAKIKEAGWERANISVPVEAKPVDGEFVKPTSPTPAPQKIGEDRSGKNDPMVKIMIPKQAGPGGDRPVSVGVNGTHILIPREEEVEVAARYVLVLQNAVQTEYLQNEETNEVIGRDVLMHPFNILSGREHVQ